MKKILLYILVILLVTTIASFILGYFEFGMLVAGLLMVVAMGTANVYSQKNAEYMHNKYHDDYVSRNKR